MQHLLLSHMRAATASPTNERMKNSRASMAQLATLYIPIGYFVVEFIKGPSFGADGPLLLIPSLALTPALNGCCCCCAAEQTGGHSLGSHSLLY